METLTINRRAMLLAGACSLIASPALAQRLSERTITIVVPFTPGTGIDILARLLGEQIQKRLGADGHRREQAGRQRQHRQPAGGPRRAGRPHAAHDRQHVRHERQPLQESAVRPAEKLCADHRGCDRLARARRASVAGGRDRRRVCRPCQSPAGRDQLCVAGTGHAAASRHGVAQAQRRHLAPACALFGIGRRGAGPGRRARPCDVPAAAYGAAAGCRQADTAACRRQRRSGLPRRRTYRRSTSRA